jgi:hypothetical protein
MIYKRSNMQMNIKFKKKPNKRKLSSGVWDPTWDRWWAMTMMDRWYTFVSCNNKHNLAKHLKSN